MERQMNMFLSLIVFLFLFLLWFVWFWFLYSRTSNFFSYLAAVTITGD
jgi:hypothetical protein